MNRFIVTLALILLSHIISYASEPKLLVTAFRKTDNYAVKIHNPTHNNILIKLIDQNGKALFQEMVKSIEVFEKVYNLSSLPKGTYTILVENKFGQARERIEVKNAVGSHPEIGLNLLVGFSKITDNQMKVVVQNKTKRNAQIAIFDSNGKKVSTVASSDKIIIKHMIDLSKLAKGDYKIKVTDGKSVFTKSLRI